MMFVRIHLVRIDKEPKTGTLMVGAGVRTYGAVARRLGSALINGLAAERVESLIHSCHCGIPCGQFYPRYDLHG